MCGIAGFWDPRNNYNEKAVECLQRMLSLLNHRGPDARGAWSDNNSGLHLGHTRLSILDLSPAGAQPMHAASGRYVISFNGEIYNHDSLRKDLVGKGIVFKGHSDTEVMLAAFDAWGIEAAVCAFVGMFAFALWDRKSHTLWLARDRAGEKPLYYGWNGSVLLFGSELKALRAHPVWKGEIDSTALGLYLRHNYVPAPHTIYRNFNKLPPASLLSLRLDGLNPVLNLRTYWSCVGSTIRESLSPGDAVEELTQRLEKSIELQKLADVPIGAFLSGGVDSSLIVALMQRQGGKRTKTFSVGFQEEAYDESDFARKVAEHLGTEHTEFLVSPRDALDVIPKLPDIYDEPFSDSSQIPTYLVAHLARQHVTVALSGDGGDELFGGYSRYPRTLNRYQQLKRVPWPIRKVTSNLLDWVKYCGLFLGIDVKPFGLQHNTYAKAQEWLRAREFTGFYRTAVSHWRETHWLVNGFKDDPGIYSNSQEKLRKYDPMTQMRILDFESYLPDDVLVKTDRAAMACSLEGRMPLLDHRVVEWAFSLPNNLLFNDGRGKWPLRAILYRFLPKELVDRPKKGFSVPIAQWLRVELREWAENLLDIRKIREQGYLNPKMISSVWQEHLSGARENHYYLWDILMFQAWLEAQKKP